ncbi:RhoGAP-domain-containing protein [Trametes coccinea BRFM310]|uniref:RhoGAP-domain-containing protein n=1 Tax=Trametes coccinea (strain BRFM310) TaxID=1353009 RepID=A0A1Y2IXH7_TRAC3|nr:RhoGAP-domain-containing protein [Trametes coccinea BRFM310]
MSSSAEAAAAASKAPAMDAAQSATNLFELHLKVLADSYLAFFQERKRIEEQYVAALFKLHRKAKSVDAFLDDRIDLSTTRVVWNDITDNVEREAQTRTAFLENLGSNVIDPLANFKEEQDRIRKRIREDLKDAITAHADFAENVLPRLKRNYLKKCQEAEEYKSAAAAPLSPTSPPDNHHHMPPLSKPHSQGANGARPVVTAPQPLRPLDRRPSTSAHAHRNRSPSASTSTALQDLAHQGKKQLNQLMTFLDKGGNVRDGGRSDNALRSVRAKREAEEADKEYRKAVHWLETLRIRRVKLLESGFKSVESFVRESSETVKKAIEVYIDNLTAAAATQSQLCEHGRRMVDKIVPQRDSATIAESIPRMLAAATPKPVYYYNYNVGECKDLIFGVSLVDYATARGLPEGEIPKIVRICIQDIEQRGLDAEGIYRVSGRHAAVQELQHKIERNEAAFQFNPTTDDVYSVSSFLKMYLRELPEPVFKFPLQERIQHTEGFDEHAANNFAVLRSKMRRLPAIHQATLKALVEHLAKVASHAEKNKMDAKNLAIVFGSVIFGEEEIPKGVDLLSVQSWKDSLMEDLITNAHVLFSQTASPPLPPAPLNEPAPSVSYGTAHTKVSNMPPPPAPTSPRRHQKAMSLSSPRSSNDSVRSMPQDFAPRLPPRPTDSIHPSLRAGPHSSSPARQPPSVRVGQWFDDQVRVPPYGGSASSHEGSASATSISPTQPPPLEGHPSISGSSTAPSLTESQSQQSAHSREPSSKRSSRQMPSDVFSQERLAPGERSTGPSPTPMDVFSPPRPSSAAASARTQETGLSLSSTAAAAAFASSATPSPTSSNPSSHQSSPSKRSVGHGRHASD